MTTDDCKDGAEQRLGNFSKLMVVYMLSGPRQPLPVHRLPASALRLAFSDAPWEALGCKEVPPEVMSHEVQVSCTVT
ncbi:hypothetical protein KC19_1G156700 [Ceratodon purpureus]|uniref:Uncharacterized protein n=1 Tax=Ceratodon purpureus TaxID=3225 RepID=A0A8T0J5L1_CERPU|nr:hypothetical protein KC19_1G156700 [Ceratodon purpureus]